MRLIRDGEWWGGGGGGGGAKGREGGTEVGGEGDYIPITTLSPSE